MRWLCSAFVGADCWLAVCSDKPSNSPPSSPEGRDHESDKQSKIWIFLYFFYSIETQLYNFLCPVQHLKLTLPMLHQWCQCCGLLTDSEVNVAFASTHDQEGFGLWGRCVRGFRRRVIRAWICGAWRGHRLTCDKQSHDRKEIHRMQSGSSNYFHS